MINPQSKTQSGFTLIEIVIVIFLFSVLLMGLFSIFEWQQKVYTVEMAEVRVTSSARSALAAMNSVIAQGIEIIPSRTINGVLYTTGGSTVVVKLPVITSSDEVLPNQYDYAVFHRDGQNLFQIIEANAASIRQSGSKLLSDNVHNFSLSYNGGDIASSNRITATITNRATYRGDKFVEFSLSQTILLRNH
jgi:prepilin-type N-terminal cleavage/methylation domain-containing protein